MRVPFVLPAVLLVLAQQVVPPPPRDPARRPPPPEVKGTGVIRGRVVAADTGSPIRRANVNLTMMPPPMAPGSSTASGVLGNVVGGSASPAVTNTQTVVINGVPTSISTSTSLQGFSMRPHSTTTDAQGVFEFKELPPGAYRLTASPGQYNAQYLTMAYGAKKPNGPGSFDPGQPIQLPDGGAFEKATIALTRGSVITGRVTDENGDPLARVQVYTVFFPPGSARGMRTGGNSQSDDLGQYRIYGLAPGEYTIVAEGRMNTYVPPNAPPESEEDRIGFLTTFYPGTPDETAAQHVRVRAATETSGLEIRLATGRLLHITGTVTDSQGRAGTRISGSLSQRSKLGTNVNSYGFSTDQDGRFQMRNVAPGTYRLNVRQMRQNGPGMVIDGPPGSQPDPGEFASIPITLTSDLDNLLVTTSPGVTITGQIVYDSGPPQLAANQQSTPLRVTAQFADNDGMGMIPSPPPAVVGPELTFTLKGLMGEYLIRGNGPGQYLKAVLLGGADDIIDTPHEFKQGDRVTLIMSTRSSTLEGNVTDAKGAPVTDAAIMMFSEDKAAWRTNSIRTRRSGTDQNGHYRIPGLLPGRYFIVATTRERMNIPSPDAAFFEELSKDATSIVIGEDEQRQADLKASTGGGS